MTAQFLVEHAPVSAWPAEYLQLPMIITVQLPAVPNIDFHCEECPTVYRVRRTSAEQVRSPLGLRTENEGQKPQVYVCDHYGKILVAQPSAPVA